MGGDAEELGRAARISAMSHPPCALAPAAAPRGQEPPRPESSSSSWHRNCSGDVGGAGGRGKLLSLRQKDAGQHFIHNHLNVFAVFKGCLGSGVKRFHLSSRLHVGEGGELVPAGSCCGS